MHLGFQHVITFPLFSFPALISNLFFLVTKIMEQYSFGLSDIFIWYCRNYLNGDKIKCDSTQVEI